MRQRLAGFGANKKPTQCKRGGGGIAKAAGSSFPIGTLIWTEDGFKPIEQIEVDDLVWSRDENDPDGSNVLNPVTETFNRITSDMNVLTLKTNTIDGVNGLTLVSNESVGQTHEVRLTPEHPVYVINRYGEEIG